MDLAHGGDAENGKNKLFCNISEGLPCAIGMGIRRWEAIHGN
jgi:hypothetical protein